MSRSAPLIESFLSCHGLVRRKVFGVARSGPLKVVLGSFLGCHGLVRRNVLGVSWSGLLKDFLGVTVWSHERVLGCHSLVH